MPGGVDADGDVVLDGDGKERGWINFEVSEGGGDRAGDVDGGPLDDLVEGDVGEVGCVAGDLDVEINIKVWRVDVRLGETEADGDEGEVGSADDLEHVEIAVGVAGVEGFDRNGEEEVALQGLTDAFASRGVADAIDFVERMGHVVVEGGLVEDPSLIGLSKGGDCQEAEDCKAWNFQRDQNFTGFRGGGGWARRRR